MRSPVIAFSLLAAAAVSPALVAGAPASPKLENAIAQTEAAANTHQIRAAPDLPGPLSSLSKALGGAPPAPPASDVEVDNGVEPSKRTEALRQAATSSKDGDDQPKLDAVNTPQFDSVNGPQSDAVNAPQMDAVDGPQMDAVDGPQMGGAQHMKRAGNQDTAGGNSFSGAAGSTSGGSVYNEADRGPITNDDNGKSFRTLFASPFSLLYTDPATNDARIGGNSYSGFSYGGSGKGRGPGGNAYSGATGTSNGGSVYNEASSARLDPDTYAINNLNGADGTGASK